MFNSQNSLSLLIGKSLSRTASVQILDPTATTTYIASGEVLVLDQNDTPLNPGATITDSMSIRIVQGDGTTNPLVFSPKMDGNNVIAFKGLSFAPAQEQISYVGYNTTSGTIEAINGNLYKLRITMKWDKEMWSEQQNTRYYEYTSDSSATGLEVAEAFVNKIIIDAFGSAEIKAEMVTDGTFTVLGGAVTAVVTNGSTIVTASGAGHNLVTNDLVRIGGPGASFAVYRVASVNGAVITLASKFQGTSGTVVNANIGEMSVVTSYGIKITGKLQAFAIPYDGLFRYQKVSFDVLVSGFGATAVSDVQTVNRGSGVDAEIAELEFFSLGSDGIRNRSHHPIPSARHNVASGAQYDVIYIEFRNTEGDAVISGTKPSKHQLYIALVDGAAQSTNLLAQLNPWMASTARKFASVAI